MKNSSRIFNEFEEPMVSLFESWCTLGYLGRIPITEFLMTQKYKEQVEDYRKSRDSKQRDKIKYSIESITPSSICKYGQESYFNEYSITNVHTNLICVDIDSKDNQNINLLEAKHIIGQYCPSLYYGGLSIGGEGIFLIFRVSNPYFHNQHFNALMYYLKEGFRLNVDRTVKSPVSLRMASYDDNPYYNPNPIPFVYIKEIRSNPISTSRENETREHVENAIKEIKMYQIDITKQHLNKFKIGCALAYEFGEEGRNWFHMVSNMYKDYNRCECDFEYDKCLIYKKGKIKIGTFFHHCRENGIRYWK